MADKLATSMGIDLGTTFSAVGIMENGAPKLLLNEQGKTTTPSYVAFTTNQRIVGDPAKS